MNTTFKTVLVLAAVALTVFGITVIGQYSLKPESTKPTDVKDGGEFAGEVVRYDMRQMRLDAKSPYLAQRLFPGYFEEHESLYVVFWLNNPNPTPVRISTKGRSCTSCTEASLSVFDTEAALMEYLAPSAAILGGAALAAPDQFNVEAWTAAAAKLPAGRWQALDFDHPDSMITVPAANPNLGPTWVALRVKLVVKPGPHIDRPITADLAFHTDQSKFPQQTKFSVEYVGVPPFDIMPKELKFGDFTPAMERKSIEVIYFSSTQSQLPPPVVAADAKDPFLAFEPAVQLTDAELKQLIASQGGAQAGVRIISAYRLPVVLNRKSGNREVDIGPLEKSFTVTAASGSGAAKSVQGNVKATVQGVVSLDGGAGAVDLGDFNSRVGTRKEATLVTDQADIELDPLPNEHKPAYLQVKLGEPRKEGDRKLWTMTLSMDPNVGSGNLPVGSAAVFKVRSTGQILRIPVKGHGKVTSR